MFIKTVSTTSGINPIKFDETGGVFYWILNTGSSTIYASTKSAFTAGDDGVVSLGPKESRRLETNNDTIYILGEGQVEIHNQRDGICSFKQAPTSSGSGGGGTVDAYTKTESDAKYAQKTDIPSSLPANGGNADTLDGLHSNEIAINPNLLINPDFRINQRGVVSGDTLVYGRYSLDRWRILYNNLDYKKSINITSDGIELVTTNGAGNSYYGDFHQIFENPLPSGYYTMSGKIDGVIRTYTGYLAENADSILFDGVFILAHTSFAIRFYDDTRKIEWVKLEVGQMATSFVPPDPALELVKCQRFYREIVGQFIPTIITSGMTSTYITIDNMRISTNDDGSSLLPTAYFKNTMFNADTGARVTNNSGSVISGFVFSITTVDKGKMIEVRAKKASHGLDRNTHVFVIDTNNPICISTEI